MSAGPEELTRPLRRPGYGWDKTSSAELEPTHHIATPSQVDEDDDQGATTEDGWFVRRFGNLRFVYQPVGSLQDHLRYGRDAAISIAEKGLWRTTHIVFAKITAPLLVLAFFVIHAFLRRPVRCAWWTLGVLVAAPILHGIPVIGWLPFIGWLDMTTWFAGPDLAQCGIDVAGGE